MQWRASTCTSCVGRDRRDDIARVVETLRTETDRLDILVNNAGVASTTSTRRLPQTLAVNYFGVVRLTDAVLPLLLRPARIVMVSSSLGELACLVAGRRRYFLDQSLTLRLSTTCSSVHR